MPPNLPTPTTPYYGGGQVPNPANVIKTDGAPSTVLTPDKLGTLAVDNATASVYALASKESGQNTWVMLGDESGSVETLTGDTGVATPAAGNINILGTNLQISTIGASDDITISVPDTFTHGSSAAANAATILSGTGGISLTATNGALTANTGTGAVNISTDATATTISLGTGAGVKNVTLGSETGASVTAIDCGTGGCFVGASGVAHTTALGTTTGNSTTTIDCGTGGCLVGTSAVDHTTTIGGTIGDSPLILQTGIVGATCTGYFGLTTPATTFYMHGGVAQDFIGVATLTGGTVTISHTDVAPDDRIMISRTAVNASTTLGELMYTVNAGVSFTVTAQQVGTPASIQTGDESSFSYIIIRQSS